MFIYLRGLEYNETVIAKLSLKALSRYRVTLVVWLGVLLFGAFSYLSLLDREGFPPVEVPIAVVTGTYFVDDAELVDADVAQQMSEILVDIDEVVSVQSTARNDSFSLFVEFEQGTNSSEGAALARSEIDDNFESVNGVEYEVESISANQFNNQYDLLAAVYVVNDSTLDDLESAADDLAESLGRVDEVRSSDGIALTAEAQDPITGQTEIRQTSFSRVAVKDSENDIDFYNSALVGVEAASGVDDLDLDEAVNDEIADWNESRDDEVEAVVSAGFADIIRTQISELQTSIGNGLLAVLLVVGLLIGWRPALLVSLFIPTVMLSTLLGIYLLGYTLNVIVLFALVLTLGLIVDNATVVTEALDVARRNGKSVRKQIESALSKVGTAMIAGTLTTVLVFAPLLFVSGILGEFIRVLPSTVILALLLSLTVAIVLVPFLAAIVLLRAKKSGGWLKRPIEVSQRAIGNLPRLLVAKPRLGKMVASLMVLVSLGVVGLAGVLASQVPFNIFPESDDADAIIVNIDFASGTDIDEAIELVDEINQEIKGAIGQDLHSATYYEASERSAFAQVDLTPFRDRDTTSQEYIAQLSDSLDELAEDRADVLIRQLDAGPPPDDFPFTVEFYGEDMDAVAELGEDVASVLESETIERPDGGSVVVEEVQRDLDPEDIRRKDGDRFLSVSLRLGDEDTSTAIMAAQDFINDRFDGEELDDRGLDESAISFDLGQEDQNVESFEGVQLALGVALLLMYILLLLQFNSFLQPLLIFVAIPLSLFGVFSGLLITDNPLSFFVMVGLVGLFGIVVNNAILLLDYANQERRSGKSRVEAISSAVEQRFRPVVTTTLTTIGALLPLLLTDPFWEPLAATIVFGLISSTILVLLTFPYYYLGLEKFRDWKNDKLPYLR